MNPSESKTVVLYVSPSAYTAAATASGQIDTIGFDYLTVDLMEKAATEEAAMGALELTENDTAMSGATNYTDIVALTGASATSSTAGFVLPTPSSSVNNHYRFNINLKGRKRFIGIYTAAGTGAVGVRTIIGTLYRCQDHPAAIASTTLANTALIHQQRLVVSC